MVVICICLNSPILCSFGFFQDILIAETESGIFKIFKIFYRICQIW